MKTKKEQYIEIAKYHTKEELSEILGVKQETVRKYQQSTKVRFT